MIDVEVMYCGDLYLLRWRQSGQMCVIRKEQLSALKAFGLKLGMS